MTPQSYGLIKYEPRKNGNNNLLIENHYNMLTCNSLKPSTTIEVGNILHFLMLKQGGNDTKIA